LTLRRHTNTRRTAAAKHKRRPGRAGEAILEGDDKARRESMLIAKNCSSGSSTPA
jgi:hypothetical protein